MHTELKEEIPPAVVSAVVVSLRTSIGEQVTKVSAEPGGWKSMTVRVTCVLPRAEGHLTICGKSFSLLCKLKTQILAGADLLLRARISALANTGVTGIRSGLRVDSDGCIKMFALSEDPSAIRYL